MLTMHANLPDVSSGAELITNKLIRAYTIVRNIPGIPLQ